MFEEIIGQKTVGEFLVRSMAAGRVAHAYLFVGPEGVGKMTMARAFAMALLEAGGSHAPSLEVHPDVIFVGREIDEKSGLAKSEIVVEQIREVRTRLAHTSLLPSWKIAVIDDADTMTSGAANAFLKTLEEPTPKTVIILVARDLARIPQTVKSRVQLIRFGTVREEVLRTALVCRGVAPREAEAYARVARGRPGRALNFVANRDEFRSLVKECGIRSTLLERPAHERLKWIEKNIKGLKSAALNDELKLWQTVMHDRFTKFFDNENQTDESVAFIVHAARRQEEAMNAVRSHVDPRLIFAYFLI